MPISFKKKQPVTGSIKEEHVTKEKDADTGKVTETVEIKKDDQVSLGSVEVPQQFAQVEFAASMTKNLGNYESAKVHVGITVPCDPEKVDEAFDYASGWVNGKLEQVLES